MTNSLDRVRERHRVPGRPKILVLSLYKSEALPTRKRDDLLHRSFLRNGLNSNLLGNARILGDAPEDCQHCVKRHELKIVYIIVYRRQLPNTQPALHWNSQSSM